MYISSAVNRNMEEFPIAPRKRLFTFDYSPRLSELVTEEISLRGLTHRKAAAEMKLSPNTLARLLSQEEEEGKTTGAWATSWRKVAAWSGVTHHSLVQHCQAHDRGDLVVPKLEQETGRRKRMWERA